MSDEDRGLLSRYYHAVWEAGNVEPSPAPACKPWTAGGDPRERA